MPEREQRPGPGPVEARRSGLGYLGATALVALATALGVSLREQLAAADLVMLYLLVIGVAAAALGRAASVLASALSVLAYNFFLVPPYYTFAVHDQRHLLTFAMMFVVGLLISGFTQRIRQQALRAHTEELRSSLLSTVSHDLRTPLGAITGAGTALRAGMDSMTASQRDELLATVCEEAERLERLVRNLLDMTRLESGTLQVKREWVPLEEIVGAALNRLEPLLAGRSIRAELPVELPLLAVDPVLLEQVFINLLENACKYTPDGSPIEVRARATGDRTIVELADRGPGLPRGAETQLFDKFFRGKGSDRPGAGLGLAICRGVVEAHGGRIEAENRDGGGALFRIVLPRVGQAPAVPSDGDELQAVREERTP